MHITPLYPLFESKGQGSTITQLYPAIFGNWDTLKISCYQKLWKAILFLFLRRIKHMHFFII